MPNRLLWPSLSLVVLFALSGCLSGTSSTSDARKQPNSFPPLENDFDDTGSGDFAACKGLAQNEICVTVEVPQSLAGTGARESRRNLFIVEPTSIDVIRVGEGLEQVDALSVTRTEDEQGAARIRLNGLAVVPTDPDYIVRATLPGGAVVRGPLSDTDQDVKLNPYSEYLVAFALDDLGTEAIEDVKLCENANNICLNQLVWPTLVDQIQDFEIAIPDGVGLEGAVNYLAGRVDFTDFVDQMLDTLQIPDTSTNEIQATSVAFNTIYFGLELNRRVLQSGDTVGQWGVRSMTTGISEGNGGTSEIYPNLMFTTFDVFGISVNSFAGTVPYERETLRHSNVDSFLGLDWQPNKHHSAPGAAFARNDDLLQAGRSTLQSVTVEHDYIWGWAPDPYFLNSFMLRDDQDDLTGLLASYFNSGKALQLELTGNGKYQRKGALEDLGVSTVEVNLKQLEAVKKDEPYDLSVFDGDYNAVSFALKLDDAAANPVAVRVQASDWTNDSPGSGSALFTETNAAGWQLLRDDTGAASGPISDPTPRQVSVANMEDEIYLNPEEPNAPAYYGRLSFGDGDSQVGIGAAVVSGDLLAYTYTDTERGRGVRIVGREAGTVSFGGTYTLQGFSLGMNDQSNRLEQLNGSVLTIDPGTGVSMSLESIRVTHALDDDSVTDPERQASRAYSGPAPLVAGDNVKMTFTGEMLELEGFAAEAGDLLVLTVKDGDSVGLVFAIRNP